MMVPLAVTFSSSMVQVHVALMITDIVLFLTVISDRNTAFRMEHLLLNDLFASSRVCAHTKHIFVQLWILANSKVLFRLLRCLTQIHLLINVVPSASRRRSFKPRGRVIIIIHPWRWIIFIVILKLFNEEGFHVIMGAVDLLNNLESWHIIVFKNDGIFFHFAALDYTNDNIIGDDVADAGNHQYKVHDSELKS